MFVDFMFTKYKSTSTNKVSYEYLKKKKINFQSVCPHKPANFG